MRELRARRVLTSVVWGSSQRGSGGGRRQLRARRVLTSVVRLPGTTLYEASRRFPV